MMACAGIEPEDPTTTDGMSAAYRRYHRRLLRGEEQGWFTFGMADDLAIELLKVHPLFVWGDDLYFNPIDPNVVEEADDTEPVLAHAA